MDNVHVQGQENSAEQQSPPKGRLLYNANELVVAFHPKREEAPPSLHFLGAHALVEGYYATTKRFEPRRHDLEEQRCNPYFGFIIVPSRHQEWPELVHPEVTGTRWHYPATRSIPFQGREMWQLMLEEKPIQVPYLSAGFHVKSTGLVLDLPEEYKGLHINVTCMYRPNIRGDLNVKRFTFEFTL